MKGILFVLFGVFFFSWVSRAQQPETRVECNEGVRAAPIALRYGEHFRVCEFSSLPLLFEVNLGQVDEQVRFLARPQPGVTYFFTEQGYTVLSEQGAMANGPERRQMSGPATRSTRPAAAHALGVEFPGASPHPSISVEGEAQGLTNYFIGCDPSRWRTNVPSYRTLYYSDLYDGIDLMYYGSGARLEYDFIVHRRADPSRIRIRYSGAERPLALSPDGLVEVVTSVGSILEGRPYVYQSVSPDTSTQRPVPAKWKLAGENELSLDLEEYDTARDLHIDPLLYSTFVGAGGFENGLSIAVDAAGAVYVTGQTASTNFPTVVGSVDVSYNGGMYDAFVFKLDSSTSSLVYSTYLGGAGDDSGSKVVVDPQGNAFIMGATTSSNFPVTAGAYDESHNGGSDAFVAKLDTTGATLLYCTFLGGSGEEPNPFIQGLAVDDGGNAYVVGTTSSSDFPTTAGALDPTLNGSTDAFVTKLNDTGTALLYSTYLGGSGNDLGSGIAVDDQNNAYVIGDTESPDFPTTPGAYEVHFAGAVTGFVSKIDAAGSALVYSTYLGGSGGDFTAAVALDPSRNAYITAQTTSIDFPTTAGAFQTTKGSFQDSSVTKLSASGSTLLYSTFIGGNQDEGPAWTLSVNTAGEAFLAGATASTNFPVTAGAYDLTFGGGNLPFDGWVAKLNATGSSLLYSTYLGESAFDAAEGLAMDASGNAWVVGYTGSSNFPTTSGAYDKTFNGVADVFVTELGMPKVGKITGSKFNDLNGNGVRDAGDYGLPNWFIRLDPGPVFAKTDLNGDYQFFGEPGTYTISEITQSNWDRTYPGSGEYTVTIGEGQTVGGNDFGNQPRGRDQNLCIELSSVHCFHCSDNLQSWSSSVCCEPPIPYYYLLHYTNPGNTPCGTQVCIILPPQVDYVSSILSVPSDFTSSTPILSPPGAWWTIKSGGLTPNANGTILIKVVPNVLCQPSSQPTIIAHGYIDPLVDNDPTNNIRCIFDTPDCSHDPNDMQVTPKGCGVEGFISKEESLTYLVQFQNTGAGPAHHVVVRDTLDEDLDLAAVENLGGSYANLFEINGRELKWTFWDIVLPGSGVDEPGSHGYVKFKVKLRPDVQLAAVIENQAGIYFDLNEVVLTNTTVNTVTDAPLPVAAIAPVPESLEVGTPVDFAYTGGTSGASFLWKFGPGATPEGSIDQNPTSVTYSTPGLKNVVLQVTLGTCDAAPAVRSIVVVNPPMLGRALPGDCNKDGNRDISDAICLFGYLFLGSPELLPCGSGGKSDPSNLRLLNHNGDGSIDISDGIGLLNYLFGSGAPPASGTQCTLIEGCPDRCPR